jgi:hypothetical protein
LEGSGVAAMKVCFATPTPAKPFIEMNDSAIAEVPFMREAGLEDEPWLWEVGSAYVSYARALLIQKAFRIWKDDDGCIVFIDHDLSWKPGELTKLVQTPGDVVAGTYRFKSPDEEYMGRLDKAEGAPIPELNKYQCLPASLVPAGFLKITRTAIEIFIRKYSNLNFSRDLPNQDFCYDLFSHGTINNTWFGEDYAFCLRWRALGLPIWLRPDLDITHHGRNLDGEAFSFPGNYWRFLNSPEGQVLERPKGSIQSWAEGTAKSDLRIGLEEAA